MSLHLDTGSSDLWVNTATSRLCRPRDDPCSISGTFDANSSSTYQYKNSNFNISYADGSGATGDYGTDTLTIGGTAIKDFEFAVGYKSSSYEGVCGVGYPLIEAGANENGMKPYQNLPAKLAADGLIASSSYSLWLNDLDANTGQILFGAVDRAQFYGELVTVPIVKEQGDYYEFLVTLTDLTFDGQNVAENQKLSILLDSGTSLIYLPNKAAYAMINAVGAQYDTKEEIASVDCSLADQNFNVTFSFNNAVSIDVPISELVLPGEDVSDEDGSMGSGGSGSSSTVCIFGIAPAGNTGSVLGDTFLRSAYVVYNLDSNEIGLAQTKFNATGTADYVEISAGNGVPSATGTGQTSQTDDADSAASPKMTSPGSTIAFLTTMVIIGFFV